MPSGWQVSAPRHTAISSRCRWSILTPSSPCTHWCVGRWNPSLPRGWTRSVRTRAWCRTGKTYSTTWRPWMPSCFPPTRIPVTAVAAAAVAVAVKHMRETAVWRSIRSRWRFTRRSKTPCLGPSPKAVSIQLTGNRRDSCRGPRPFTSRRALRPHRRTAATAICCGHK